MIIEKATREDLPEILALQKIAYQSEASIYNDFAIAPLTQTLEELRYDFDQHTFLKATDKDLLIGSVRACIQDKTCYIGRLVVHPDYQNKGVGTHLMKEIEKKFKEAKRFELFTGLRSKRNLYLYQKLGYRLYKAEKLNSHLVLVFLEKRKDKFTMSIM